MDVHVQLVEARNLLARGGVCAGVFRDDGGRHCARGALLEVAGVPFFNNRPVDWGNGERPEEKEALRALEAAVPVRGERGVASWSNDLVTEGRADEVLAGFDRAIAATAPEPADPVGAGAPEPAVA